MMIHTFAKSWICNGEPSMSGPSMDLINDDYWNMNLADLMKLGSILIAVELTSSKIE